MAILSPNMSASSIECVVNTIARPGFAASMMSHVARRLIGSRPVVGSSKNTIFGSPDYDDTHKKSLSAMLCNWVMEELSLYENSNDIICVSIQMDSS